MFMIYMQKIEEAAEKGELTELVLMVIWNRLDLARRDVSLWDYDNFMVVLMFVDDQHSDISLVVFVIVRFH